MMQRIWTAYLVEVAKASRLKATYLGPVMIAAAVLTAPLLRPIGRDGVSDYAFIAYATPMALNLLGLLLVLIHGASLISTELSSGVIRLVLVRPIRRCEFLAAKLMLGMSYSMLLILCAGGSCWTLAFLFGGLSGVSYAGELMYTAGQMRNAYVLGMALSVAPYAAAVAYALMFSSFTRNTVSAIVAAVGVWIFLDLVKYPLHMSPYVFTSYVETPWRVFINRTEVFDVSWFPEAGYCLAVSVASAMVFATVAGVVLARKDIRA